MASRIGVIVVGVLVTVLGLLYGPVTQRLVVFGVTRKWNPLPHIQGGALRIIADTMHCEDLHYHAPADLLFTACQDEDRSHRSLWFPPLGILTDPNAADRGSLVVVDPKTFKAQRLRLMDFKGPLITHGIDICSSPEDPETVYIFAVNHLPNPLHYQAASNVSAPLDKARSQIELFRHAVGSDSAEHVRSIQHPLIRTPNDIYAVSSTSFYVTNDHYYRDGFLRHVEDLLTLQTAPWSDIVHIEINDSAASDPTAGIVVATALHELHNNNGLGHGSSPDEVVIADASGGLVTIARRSLHAGVSPKLEVLEHIQLDSTIDNPSYYHDRYATAANNASGHVVPGLTSAIDLAHAATTLDEPIPAVVWHVRADSGQGKWRKDLVFHDDGNLLRSASAAVMIGIDPKENGGRKQAWLFVTGFLSDAMVATKVDL